MEINEIVYLEENETVYLPQSNMNGVYMSRGDWEAEHGGIFGRQRKEEQKFEAILGYIMPSL